MENKEIKRKFSLMRRLRSVNHAWRGIGLLIRTSHNAWVHIFFGLLAVYLGFVLHISNIEWIMLVLVIGLVIVAESFNTAIEIDMDLTSPDYHPYARDAKDVAAGAVLLMVILSAIVGLLIFLPKIFIML